MDRVGNDELLDVYDIGDEAEVDDEEGQEDEVAASARQRNSAAHCAWRVGCDGGGMRRWRRGVHWRILSRGHHDTRLGTGSVSWRGNAV